MKRILITMLCTLAPIPSALGAFDVQQLLQKSVGDKVMLPNGKEYDITSVRWSKAVENSVKNNRCDFELERPVKILGIEWAMEHRTITIVLNEESPVDIEQCAIGESYRTPALKTIVLGTYIAAGIVAKILKEIPPIPFSSHSITISKGFVRDVKI